MITTFIPHPVRRRSDSGSLSHGDSSAFSWTGYMKPMATTIIPQRPCKFRLANTPADFALSSAMNISLHQVKMDASQTMFITSTGTILFTSHTMRDSHGYPSTTVITSVDDEGSIAEVGHIKWNQNTGAQPSLCVGAYLMELQTIRRHDSFATVFRGGDGRTYRWRKVANRITLSSDNPSFTPVAIAYDDAKSFSTVDSAAANVILCVQPNGFHLFREIVVTFVLFEQLSGRTRADDPRRTGVTSSPRQGSRVQHVPPARVHSRHDNTGYHTPSLRPPGRRLTRSTADLTGELLRRYKYPSAYGGFGDIWKCDWLKDSRVIEVAVKVMRTDLTGSQKEAKIKSISRELKVWMRLEHECVLPLYGISFGFGTFPAMVSPWLEGGTLSKYLEHHEGLQLHKRLQLLSDIADGLHYLHKCGVVHGDLTGSNVLIKHNDKACLSDFGLSRIYMEATGSSYLTSTIRGSIRWAAPELFEIGDEQQKEPSYALPTPQSDIYSFGSTMLQVLTGRVPYHHYKNDAQVLVALSRGMRPARPYDPPICDIHWEFMQRCWSSEEARPPVGEIVDLLSVDRNRCDQT